MSDTPTPSPLQAFSVEFADLVRRVCPSVVSVQSKQSRSSGFAWRAGLVVTAESALPDDGEISVVAHDGASSRGELVGRDPSTDVALLRIQRTDLPVAPWRAEGIPTGAFAAVVGARGGAPVASFGIVSFAGPQWRSMRGGLIDARLPVTGGCT